MVHERFLDINSSSGQGSQYLLLDGTHQEAFLNESKQKECQARAVDCQHSRVHSFLIRE